MDLVCVCVCVCATSTNHATWCNKKQCLFRSKAPILASKPDVLCVCVCICVAGRCCRCLRSLVQVLPGPWAQLRGPCQGARRRHCKCVLFACLYLCSELFCVLVWGCECFHVLVSDAQAFRKCFCTLQYLLNVSMYSYLICNGPVSFVPNVCVVVFFLCRVSLMTRVSVSVVCLYTQRAWRLLNVFMYSIWQRAYVLMHECTRVIWSIEAGSDDFCIARMICSHALTCVWLYVFTCTHVHVNTYSHTHAHTYR